MDVDTGAQIGKVVIVNVNIENRCALQAHRPPTVLLAFTPRKRAGGHGATGGLESRKGCL